MDSKSYLTFNKQEVIMTNIFSVPKTKVTVSILVILKSTETAEILFNNVNRLNKKIELKKIGYRGIKVCIYEEDSSTGSALINFLMEVSKDIDRIVMSFRNNNAIEAFCCSDVSELSSYLLLE